ncbi:MAG: YraN family protein [Alphaproteobacteria bacterium]|nr:YraN family protein [Alphaproteobacteria bacterium]MBR6009801.1 YraN family protein [Alphaproteobacteria bacterium]
MLSKKTSYQIGLYSEFIARMYLRFHGYKILKSRYVTGKNTNRAEIDIIAKHKNTIVFVEVKYRKDVSAAWDAITPTQAARLRRAAETYLIKTRWTGDARFDVIVVCGSKIHWAKNAI